MAGTLDTADITTFEPAPTPDRPAAPPKKTTKIPVLDGIRAVAIILVLVAHAGLDKLVPGGLGVTVFFFLSGYLITTLMRFELTRDGAIDIRKFYIRRALRIFPPLYITLFVLLGCTLLGAFPNHMQFPAVGLQFVHLANYTPSFGYNLGDFEEGIPRMPLWSLAVEEHFYLFFPLIYVFMARRIDGKRQALILLAMCGVVLAVRTVTAAVIMHNASATPDLSLIYNWTHTRIDSILFGCILAVWSNPVIDDDEHSYVPRVSHLVVALVALLMCLLIREKIGSHELFGPRAEFFRQTVRYSIQGLALFVVFSYLIRLKTGPIRAVLVSQPMKIIGLLSYTVYLVNFFIFETLHEHFPDAPHSHVRHVLTSATALVLTFGYAWLMYLVVERPLGRMRSRLH